MLRRARRGLGRRNDQLGAAVSYTTGLAASGAAIALLAATSLPGGFYTFARIALTLVAVALTILCARQSRGGWLFGLVPIAVLWNPIVPVYLTRQTWLPLDLLAAAFLAVPLFVDLNSQASVSDPEN